MPPPGPELAAFTTVFRAADSHRIKRNRQPVSCTACQRRKTKCDRQKPCGACEKRSDAAACRFGPATGPAGRLEVQARLAKLEEMVKDLATSGSGPGPGLGPGAGDGDGGSGDLVNPRLGVPPGLSGLGDGADVDYHGATSWSALVESIHDIQNVLSAEDEEEDMPPLPEEPADIPLPDIFLGNMAPLNMKEVLDSLPSRAEAEKLVTIYFNAKFLAVPFVHAHHFRRRYEAFWDKPESTSFLWLSIMFSILSIGAMIAKVKGLVGPTLLSVASPRFYMVRSAQCLMTGQYLQAKAFSVEALMMFAHSRNVQKEDSDPTIWAYYGLAVRLAQRRGYHLDAAKVSSNITPFEAEMRRRTWFMIQSSDLLFSFQLGMPPMIYQEVCSADHPSNLIDDDFDEGTELPPSRALTDPTPLLAWRIKSFLCRITRRVMRHALTTEPAPYEQTTSLNAELEAFYETVPPCYRIRSIRSTSFTDEGYTIMHRLILELMYRKTLCVLHRNYLSVNKDEVRYRASREICRDAALRILDLHLEFDQEIRPGGRMYEDRFMVSSLTLHDFLVAAMVICLDLSESTDINRYDRQHRVHILQRAHAIWTERGAKSQDARHASKVLAAILNKVETPPTADTAFSDGSTLVAGDTPGLGIGDPHAPPDLSPMQITDYPVNFDELLPLESFFGATEGLDWNSIDQYLRHGGADETKWDQLFPDTTTP
ncbi:hypothetical protein EDB81DRAFT_472782 [Dactylonectria macrodidyma]|uniref:Zn(2)-C6 fungal-type domain-containing protein n=1 Tax=Dactylonectria macrodidyma TaxID=307937 RepID=A0A9P9J7V6_9HYPO|nr:hypothetical protein EDB81DRAFT_472782 [Dactylonectria macrodidyma]